MDEEELQPHDVNEYRRARAVEIWSYSDTGHELTVEEQLFCRSYIIDRNPVAAMRRIGYSEELSNSACKTRAERMLAKPEVQDCIAVLAKNMLDALQIQAEDVHRAMGAVAFFDPRQVLQFDNGGVQLLHSKFWTREQAMAVKNVKMTKEGIQVEFNDRMRALEFLGKQLGMNTEENDIARAAAEGAARGAMEKILEITERMREPAKIEAQPEAGEGA